MTDKLTPEQMDNDHPSGPWYEENTPQSRAFILEMRGKHYGWDAMTQAYAWFKHGYRAAQSAQPAAVGAKLSESEQIMAAGRLRDFVRKVAPGQCKMLSLGEDCQCPLCDIDRLASTRAAAMEECAKICDDLFIAEADAAAESLPCRYHDCIECAAAIRNAIGSKDGTEPR